MGSLWEAVRGIRAVPRAVLLVALVSSGLLCGSGAAFAYFTTIGSAAVAASAGQLQPVVITSLAGESPSSLLVPGGPPADLMLKIDNQNAFVVSLVAVSLNGTITASNGCSPTGVTLATPANLPLTVPAGVSVAHLSGGASMDQTAASACQGASFSFPLSATVHR